MPATVPWFSHLVQPLHLEVRTPLQEDKEHQIRKCPEWIQPTIPALLAPDLLLARLFIVQLMNTSTRLFIVQLVLTPFPT